MTPDRHLIARNNNCLTCPSSCVCTEDALKNIHEGHEHLLLPMTVNMNHLDALNYLAASPQMRAKLPDMIPLWVWRPRMLFHHLYYRFRYNTRNFYTDRLMGLNISLDG